MYTGCCVDLDCITNMNLTLTDLKRIEELCAIGTNRGWLTDEICLCCAIGLGHYAIWTLQTQAIKVFSTATTKCPVVRESLVRDVWQHGNVLGVFHR